MYQIARRLAEALFAATVVVFTATAAFGAPGDWVVQSARGTVLKLVSDSWQELPVGEVVARRDILRTLRNGRLVLQQGEAVLSLGGDAAIKVDFDANRGVVVSHYLGTVSIDTGTSAVPVTVVTKVLTAVASGTAFSVTFDGDSADVKVIRGRVLVADAGAQVFLGPGQSAQTSAAGLVVAGGGALADTIDTAAGNGGNGGAGNGNAGGNSGGGNSNAGGNSEGGNSNAGGNSEGGNSNAGGNSGGGNSNAGGNSGGGNSNAGGNSGGGNSNAGGSSGGGNGNAGGNSGGVGNGNSNGGGNGSGNGQ